MTLCHSNLKALQLTAGSQPDCSSNTGVPTQQSKRQAIYDTNMNSLEIGKNSVKFVPKKKKKEGRILQVGAGILKFR